MKTFDTIIEKRVGPCYGYECHPTHSFVHSAEGAKEPDVSGSYWDKASMKPEEREEYSGYMDITFGDGTYFWRTGIDSVEEAQAAFGAALDIVERFADASTAVQVKVLRVLGFEVT